MTIEEQIGRYRGRSLKDLYPKIAEQWDYENNGELVPEAVLPGSNKIVSWFLVYYDPTLRKLFHFVWSAKIAGRVSGNGCPYLTNNAVWPGFNDLETRCPQMAMWWHPTKNGNLMPSQVSPSSHQEVWWFYPYKLLRIPYWKFDEVEAIVAKRLAKTR